MEPDAGLDSAADVRILIRLLAGGLVGMVVVGVVAFLITGSWQVVVLILVSYGVIAWSQWSAANRRVRRTRAEMDQRDRT